jgi:hypothetical protein
MTIAPSAAPQSTSQDQDQKRLAEDNRSDLGYIPILILLILDTDLSQGARVTYALMKSICGDKDHIYVDWDTLATRLSVKPDTVGRWLAELRRAGLITAQRRGRRCNLYHFTPLEERYPEKDYGERTKVPVRVPHAVLCDSSLTVGEKLHAMTVLSFGGDIFPSRRTLARLTHPGCSTDTIDRRNQALKPVGLNWEEGGNWERVGTRWRRKTNRYHFNPAYTPGKTASDPDEVRPQTGSDPDEVRPQERSTRMRCGPELKPNTPGTRTQPAEAQPISRLRRRRGESPGEGKEEAGEKKVRKLVRVGRKDSQTNQAADDTASPTPTAQLNSDAPPAQGSSSGSSSISPGPSPSPGSPPSSSPTSRSPKAVRGIRSTLEELRAKPLDTWTGADFVDYFAHRQAEVAIWRLKHINHPALGAHFRTWLDQGTNRELLRRAIEKFMAKPLKVTRSPWMIFIIEAVDLMEQIQRADPANRDWSKGKGADYWHGAAHQRNVQISDADLQRFREEQEARVKEEAERKARQAEEEDKQYPQKLARWELLFNKEVRTVKDIQELRELEQYLSTHQDPSRVA